MLVKTHQPASKHSCAGIRAPAATCACDGTFHGPTSAWTTVLGSVEGQTACLATDRGRAVRILPKNTNSMIVLGLWFKKSRKRTCGMLYRLSSALILCASSFVLISSASPPPPVAPLPFVCTGGIFLPLLRCGVGLERRNCNACGWICNSGG